MEVVQTARMVGGFPSQELLEHALDRVEPLAVDTIACHHGSVLKGDPQRYYRALREHPIGDIIECGFYEGKLPGAPAG